MVDIEDLFQTGLVERWIISFIDVPGQIACVVFVRGCSIKCQDCHNCALQNKNEGGTLYTAATLAAILNAKHLPNWICFQGGEPLDQSEYVIQVIRLLDPRFHIAIYTGYNFNIAFKKYFALMDLPNVRMLKAGPYINVKRIHDKFLATSNQKLFVKTINVWEPVQWQDLTKQNLASIFTFS
jgi:organic radical activating enzyme